MLNLYLLTIEDHNNDSDFIRIYNEYNRLLYKVAFYYTKDHHLAEDAMQTAFMGLAKNIDKIKSFDKKVLEHYLCKSIKNCAISVMKKEIPVRNKTISIDDLRFETADESTFEESFYKKELITSIIDYINTLDEQQRDIIALHIINGLTFKECASALSIPPSTVKTKLYRALKEIEQIFKEGRR